VLTVLASVGEVGVSDGHSSTPSPRGGLLRDYELILSHIRAN
jgi:hypothetical protein